MRARETVEEKKRERKKINCEYRYCICQLTRSLSPAFNHFHFNIKLLRKNQAISILFYRKLAFETMRSSSRTQLDYFIWPRLCEFDFECNSQTFQVYLVFRIRQFIALVFYQSNANYLHYIFFFSPPTLQLIRFYRHVRVYVCRWQF